MIKDNQFQSPWWLKGPHMQTIWSSMIRKPVQLDRKRERVFLDDDFIDLDWAGNSGPITIILHGLTGSSDSNYVLGLQKALLDMGWRSVAMNFRGCSGEPNLKARTYHSGETSDFDAIYEILTKREPNTPFFAVGFSLGGNVLLKWLGEKSHHSQLIAATAVSVPFLLSPCADKMDSGFSVFYRNRFIKKLVGSIEAKKRFLKEIGNFQELENLQKLGDLSTINSFWEFDNRITAKLFGFHSAGDYYQQASSKPYLKRITTPTLIIQAKNDPVVCESTIPEEKHLSPVIQLDVYNTGGHVGFVSGKPFEPTYWLEERIPAFLKENLHQSEARSTHTTRTLNPRRFKRVQIA